VALVPAYNEEAGIEQTIRSLMNQSVPFEYVMVIANNCRDRTVKIVRNLQQEFGYYHLRLVDVPENPDKKSGALNVGFAMVDHTEIDYVFSMDGDTVVHRDINLYGLQKLESDESIGGTCSAYRTRRIESTATNRWQKLLWRVQNVEFGLANAWRAENWFSARVLPGVAVMYRTSALLDVQRLHGDGTVWQNNHLVEDYRLTLELKDIGWKAMSSFDMVSWSDVPLKLNGTGGLWQQRIRWYSGTVDELRQRGLMRHSRYEMFTVFLMPMNLLFRLLLLVAYAMLLMQGKNVQLMSVFLILPVLASIMMLAKFRTYGDRQDSTQYLLVGSLAIEAYNIYREVMYTYSIWLSYFRPQRGW